MKKTRRNMAKAKKWKLPNFTEIFSPLTLGMLTVAGIVNAFGVTFFLAPVQLYDSGISGTSMLLSRLTGNLPLALFLLLLNIPLFLFGHKRQGRTFTVRSLYTVGVYSAFSLVFTALIPTGAGSPISGEDLLLCALFGGIVSGIGSGITIRFGGAIDGMEVLAVIFAKPLGMTVGTFVMAYNALLYLLAGVVTGSWILPLYSIVTYMAGLKTIDFIVEGLDKAKAASIITSKPDAVCKALSEYFGKGITILNAHGYYANEPRTMVYFVVNRFQIAKLRSLVHHADENAFISITEVSDLFGKSVKKGQG